MITALPGRSEATAITSPLTALLQSHPSPCLIIDSSRRIRQVNRKLEQTLGLSAADVVEGNCCRFDADPAQSCRHRRFFTDLEPYAEMLTLRVSEDQTRVAQVHGFPALDSDGHIYLCESFRLAQPSQPAVKLVASSAVMRQVLDELLRAAATETAVLLRGETGSGKEVAAQLIHERSARAHGPFVTVDCTVLSEELFESELFGHVKGAFTGAIGNKVGLLELADGGTLFFDEIGELPLSQQPKLLRALETGTFRPVGSTQTRKARVRILSATHQDLAAMVASGAFRQDLYYRLAVFPVSIPPLRERREDIPALTEHLLNELTQSSAKTYQLDREAMRKLLLHDFPGNIRELRNILHLAAAMSQGSRITAPDIRLPDTAMIPARGPAAASQPQSVPSRLQATLSPIESAEAEYIMDLLHQHRGRRGEVAARMSISERTLYRKLKRYGLNIPIEEAQRA